MFDEVLLEVQEAYKAIPTLGVDYKLTAQQNKDYFQFFIPTRKNVQCLQM